MVVITSSEAVFDCHSKACAPPPAGKGGSIDGHAARVGQPRSNTLFTGSPSLKGRSHTLMNKLDADRKGLSAPGHHVIESGSGRGRSYVRPTGKIIPANRTRGALVEYAQHEMKTVAKDVNGRPTVMGEPGAEIGKMYALQELHN